MEKAKRYKGICPTCGKAMWIRKSVFMEMGANVGSGTCPNCETFLHIIFNPEREEMDLERFEDYQEK